MRADGIICNRCEAVIRESVNSWFIGMKPWAKFSVWTPEMRKGATGPPDRVNLCGSCYEEFVKWLEGE